MKKSTAFDRAMQQITTEYHAQCAEEERRARRARMLARIRQATGPLLLFAIFCGIFFFRSNIETYVIARLSAREAAVAAANGTANGATSAASPTTPKGAAAVAVQKAQDNAKIRDALIEGTLK